MSIYTQKEYQIILIGVNSKRDTTFHFLLSPGKQYKLQECDELVFIAKDEEDVMNFYHQVS